MARATQRVCHHALPRLISFSLDVVRVLMKSQVMIAVSVLACCTLSAATPLTAEEIHRAVDEAAKQFLGDCDSGCDIVVHREFYYGSLSRDIRESYLKVFDSFSFTEDFLRLAVPRPLPPEVLQAHPSSLELFVSP